MKILIKLIIAALIITILVLMIYTMNPVLIVLALFIGSGAFYIADMAGDWLWDKYQQRQAYIEYSKKWGEITIHEHKYEFQYRTGSPQDGQSEVGKCECGGWGVRHYGQAHFKSLTNNLNLRPLSRTRYTPEK